MRTGQGTTPGVPRRELVSVGGSRDVVDEANTKRREQRGSRKLPPRPTRQKPRTEFGGMAGVRGWCRGSPPRTAVGVHGEGGGEPPDPAVGSWKAYVRRTRRKTLPRSFVLCGIYALGGARQIVKSSATKNLFRRAIIEASSRSGINEIDSIINISLGNSTKIKAFGKPETKQTVHVFV